MVASDAWAFYDKGMNPLPPQLYRAAQTRDLDACAIHQFQVPGLDLMTRAGSAGFACLRRSWPEARRIVIVCGIGNNGGDGYVVARLATAAGLEVELLQLGDPGKQKGDALAAREQMAAAGVSVKAFDAEALREADVIVDGLFGTGLDRPPTGLWAEAITAINNVPAPVLALDIPSGLSADTGRALGEAVNATVTLTFIGLKQGLFTHQGPDHCGEILFDDLAVPPEVYEQVPSTVSRLGGVAQRLLLPPRRHDFHKGDAGHVLVVGGDRGMAGAVRMAAEAALRSGAGLVSVATRRDHATLICTERPEIMAHGVECGSELAPLLARAGVVVIGPGLGQEKWGQAMLEQVLTTTKSLVVDADGLNLIAAGELKRSHWLLTPHPGEAARLLECSVAEIQEDRFAAARAITQRYGGVCLLKGVGSLIDDGDRTWVCDAGNPGMASAGMGDILSGVCAALIAQGKQYGRGLAEMAAAAAWCHARAGDLAAADAPRGLLASDLFNYLRQEVNRGQLA